MEPEAKRSHSLTSSATPPPCSWLPAERYSDAQVAETRDALAQDITILVTGGSRGIGLSIVEEAARLKWSIAFIGRKPASDSTRRTERRMCLLGAPKCTYFSCDLSNSERIETMFSEVVASFGTIHFLVNCAGTGGPSSKPLYDLSAGDIQGVIDTNFTAAVNLTRLVWRTLREAGLKGAVVNVSSIGSSLNVHHAQYIPLYSPTKAAMDQLTRSLALPAKADGLRVYCVNPGVTDTDMGRGVDKSQFPVDNITDFAKAYNVAGTIATPESVAHLVLALLYPNVGDYAWPVGSCIACYGDGQVFDMALAYSAMASQSEDALGWSRGLTTQHTTVLSPEFHEPE
eukprot:m.9335 g.9335  ORF g.9335 m.9335 type:complete len:343 (-) comp5442_c0_seq1:1246-2274(-)